MFYFSIFGHLFIYFGTIIVGIYFIEEVRKLPDDKINNMTKTTKYSFVGLCLIIYIGAFMHYIGAISWLVN